jgi:hypothetical protein
MKKARSQKSRDTVPLPGSTRFFLASKLFLVEQIAINLPEYDEHIVRQPQLTVNLTQIANSRFWKPRLEFIE